MTLTEFLLARIAEDEAAAHAIQEWPTAIYVTPAANGVTPSVGIEAPGPKAFARIFDGATDVDWGWRVHESAVKVYEPARVLAECEAKRRIVQLHEVWDNEDSGQMSPSYWEAPVGAILCALALPYVDHPDFDETWRP